MIAGHANPTILKAVGDAIKNGLSFGAPTAIETEMAELVKSFFPSFLQNPNQILKKIKSFSHGEHNNEKLYEKKILDKILMNEDIFNRGFKLKKVEIDKTYPKYILDNQQKYLEWIA